MGYQQLLGWVGNSMKYKALWMSPLGLIPAGLALQTPPTWRCR